MLSKEEYERTIIRMWDSVRDDNKGEPNCHGAKCVLCPFWRKVCKPSGPFEPRSAVFSAYDAIEIVEQWGKEHPIITRSDKFKEVFGKEPRYHSTGDLMCPLTFTEDEMSCRRNLCKECCEKFWSEEYIPPKGGAE